MAQLNLFRAGTAGRHSIDKHFHIVEALQDGDVQATADRIVDHLEPAFSYLDPPQP